MKIIRRNRMIPLEGRTIREFSEDYDAKMEWIAGHTAKHEEPVISLDKLTGYVICEEIERIPEGFKDQLELMGQTVSCGQCKHFSATRYSRGTCPYVRPGKGVPFDCCREADEACDRFFKAWEAGEGWFKEGEEEKYAETIEQFRCPGLRNVT